MRRLPEAECFAPCASRFEKSIGQDATNVSVNGRLEAKLDAVMGARKLVGAKRISQQSRLDSEEGGKEIGYAATLERRGKLDWAGVWAGNEWGTHSSKMCAAAPTFFRR